MTSLSTVYAANLSGPHPLWTFYLANCLVYIKKLWIYISNGQTTKKSHL